MVVWWPGMFIDNTDIMLNDDGKARRYAGVDGSASAIGVIRSADRCQQVELHFPLTTPPRPPFSRRMPIALHTPWDIRKSVCPNKHSLLGE